MHETSIEYRTVSVSEPLRQGDVLEAVDAEASMWQRHLIVITADCDFAHDKHQGRVTCIPLLTADEYQLEMRIPRLRDVLAKKPLVELRTILKRTQGPEITENRLRQWASAVEVDDAIASLNLAGVDAEGARRSLECLRKIDAPAEDLDSAVGALIEAQMCGPEPPKNLEKATRSVVSSLQDPYARTPGDALFISSFSSAHDDGYFAYLRHIEQVWQPDIATGPAHRDVQYRRIARFHDRYIHALVLQFAMVFMSIGLPSEYEEMRSLHAELIGGRFT